MSRIERLSTSNAKILDDGELAIPLSVVDQFCKLTKSKSEMSTDEIIAFINLSAQLTSINERKSTSFSNTFNLEAFRQPK